MNKPPAFLRNWLLEGSIEAGIERARHQRLAGAAAARKGLRKRWTGAADKARQVTGQLL